MLDKLSLLPLGLLFGGPGGFFGPKIPEIGLPIFSANCAPVWVSDSFGSKISGERAAHRSLRTLKRVAGVGVLPCFSGFKLCFFCALHRWQNSDFLKGPGVSFLALLAFRGLLFVVCLVFGGLTWSLIGAKWARCLFAFRCCAHLPVGSGFVCFFLVAIAAFFGVSGANSVAQGTNLVAFLALQGFFCRFTLIAQAWAGRSFQFVGGG